MNGIRVSFLVLTLSISHAETISSVRGSVQTNNQLVDTPLLVVLESIGPGRSEIESMVNGDGSFEFRDVSSGVHRLRLTTPMGKTINEEMVNVTPSRSISIQLPEGNANKSVSHLVSVKRLLHPTPGKALRAFAEAQKESEKGRPAEAARKLERAVSLDPNYYEARTNLGVQYMRLGRDKEAAEQFEIAAASAPPSPIVYGNMAAAYLSMRKYEEAVEAARRTLDLDKSHAVAHYVAGSVLARGVRPGSLEKAQEAVRHLRQAAAVTPRVHMAIARINELTGDQAGVAEELRLYLKSGDSAYRADAERWLAGY